MFLLSLKEVGTASDSAKRSMAKGNLYEFFVTGATTDPRDINAIIKKKKGAFDGMLKKTVEKIRRMAEDTKKHILEQHEAQLRILYEKDKRFILESNIDIIALVQFKELNYGEPFIAILDTKWTASIEEVWNTKSTKEDFLQSFVYIWQVYEATGKMIPFVYIIAQDLNDETLIKPIMIEAKEEHIDWFKNTYIEPILADEEFAPKASEYNCLGKRAVKGKCRYLHACEAGKAMITKGQSHDFENLNE